MSKRKFSLQHAWEKVRTVPGLGKDVTAIVVLIAACVGSMAYIQSNLGGGVPWSDNFKFTAEFDQVPGLNPTASHYVTIAGVQVGDITGWEPTDRGTALVTMEIEEGQARVHDNATAVMRAENALNEVYIEINPGGPPGQPLEQNGTVPLAQTKRAIQADEALSHLDERSRQALTDMLLVSDTALARAPEQLPGGLSATKDTLVEVRPVVEALQTRREKISQLVTSLSQISGAVGQDQERVARLADATQETLGVLAENDGALRASLEQLPGLSAELRNALTSTQELTAQLDPTLVNLNEASEELPGALDQFRGTVDELGTVVDAAKPVLAKARPVVADLRPLVSDVDLALDDALPITGNLDRDTNIVTSYLTEIQAFVYNTSSVFGTRDASGGIIRGHVVVAAPDGPSALPGGQPINDPGAENGLEPGEPQGPTPIPPDGQVPNQTNDGSSEGEN